MTLFKFALAGILFGVALSKGQVISWYRIYEMFRFDSFHMYGIIGSAVVLGVFIVLFIKRTSFHDMNGKVIRFNPKNMSIPRYLYGGIIFGLGWAMTGACPGPMYILLGKGFWIIGFTILGALLGTFLYGILRDKIPH
ncbi:MAG: transporter [Crocinitomicaceae bacterium]|nr:transporter [Crocinitomicaceae bacterium]